MLSPLCAQRQRPKITVGMLDAVAAKGNRISKSITGSAKRRAQGFLNFEFRIDGALDGDKGSVVRRGDPSMPHLKMVFTENLYYEARRYFTQYSSILHIQSDSWQRLLPVEPKYILTQQPI